MLPLGWSRNWHLRIQGDFATKLVEGSCQQHWLGYKSPRGSLSQKSVLLALVLVEYEEADLSLAESKPVPDPNVLAADRFHCPSSGICL